MARELGRGRGIRYERENSSPGRRVSAEIWNISALVSIRSFREKGFDGRTIGRRRGEVERRAAGSSDDDDKSNPRMPALPVRPVRTARRDLPRL